MTYSSTTDSPREMSPNLQPLQQRTDALVEQIQNGEDLRTIIGEAISICSLLPNVISAKVFQNEIDHRRIQDLTIVTNQPLDTTHYAQVGQSSFDLHHGELSLGKLSIIFKEPLDDASSALVSQICYNLGVALSAHHYKKRIATFENRLEVLNEVNQLISADVPLDRTIATLTRSIAFRFAADCALTVLKTDNRSALHVLGRFGNTGDLPENIALRSSIFEKLLSYGGIISINDLKTNHEDLDALAQAGITTLHAIAIESGSDIVGAILIGYRKLVELEEHDNEMLEEFARGAAIALFRADSREKLRNYTEELETLVQSRTADLEIQTQRAEEANQAKSQFVANMSHELRTPLTAIVAYSNVMSDSILGPINAQQKDALDAIFRSAQHLKELIDDVLDISKVEAGKTKPEPAAISLHETLTYVFKLMHQTAVGKGVKLLPYKSDKDVKLFVDPRQIRQALLNLISNAIKYTPTGGEVQITTESGSDKIKIMITDSGIGIPEQDVSRLFERYERGSDNFSKDQKGTGIGLSLTKNLVELNNGKIGVESTFGQGSTFWILIPRADELPEVENAVNLSGKRRALNCRLDGLHVLIIDDNESTCEVLEMILMQVGAKTTVAHSVAQAKEIATSSHIDAALVDLALPEENGVGFIKFIRNGDNSLLQKIPLIVVSACVFQSDIEDAQKAGASAFVAKPFQPQDLIEEIRIQTTNRALIV